MDDCVRLLEEEKTKLEEKFCCTLNEKSDLESELKLLNDKFQEESYLRLVNENELSEITEQLKEVKDEETVVIKELDKLKEEMVKSKNELDNKDVELVKCKDELSAMQISCEEAENSIKMMKEQVESLVGEKDECEKEVVVYQEKLKRLQCTMDQEVSSLRFQLSSEALKYDEEIKVSTLASTHFSNVKPAFSTRRLFSREATFSFVGVAYHISKCDADKGKSRFARKKSPSGKRA